LPEEVANRIVTLVIFVYHVL